MESNELNFSDILSNKISVAEWALKNNTSRQNASCLLKTYLNKFYKDEEFKKLEDEFVLQKENIIKTINIKKYNNSILEVFKYKYKNNIINIGKKLFYSSIEKNNLNFILKETLTDMCALDIEKALLSNNINADIDFIALYSEKSVFSDLKIRPLGIMESILKEYGKPMSKEELVSLATSYGVSFKTATNIIRTPTNNLNKFVNLGKTVCDRTIFFESYIDEEYKNKLILAAIAVCEKNDVCSTDIKWIVNQIKINYPEIDTNKYTLLELKAIICNEEQFQQGKKLNVVYLDKQCQFAPNTATELVENILENYKLPVCVTFLGRKIKEKGKIYSQTTLTSVVMPSNPNFTKIENSGWVLTKYKDYAIKTIEEANKISKEDFWNQLKKQLEVVTITDMAKKLGINLNTIYVAYYKNDTFEVILTRLTENDWDVVIEKGKVKLTKKEEAK